MKHLLGLGFFATAYGSTTPRIKMVEEINSSPGVLWKAGLNERFANSPVGVAADLCGVRNDSYASLLKAVQSGHVTRAPPGASVSLPTSFDSAVQWPHCSKMINDIRDQSNCGCCWAFAAAEAASDRLCISSQGKYQFPLSAQEVCFCTNDDNNGCHGGALYDPWAYIQSTGAVTGGQYNGTGPFGSGFCQDYSLPHCHHHGPQGQDPYPAEGTPGCPAVTQNPACPASCASTAKAPHNDFASDKYTFTGDSVYIYAEADSIAQAIMQGGPVETAFSVYEDFENYVGGIYHHVTGSFLGGHAVKIVGWGEENGVQYWKVANSWNRYWGEGGFFRIRKGADECGIEGQVTVSGPKAVWGPMKN